MQTIFLVCVVVGGTLLLCQFLLALLGIGHHDVGSGHDFDHDLDHDTGHGHGVDHDHHSWYVGILTFRALVTAVTFFGLAGMVASHSTDDSTVSLGVASCAGAASLAGVAWIMRLLERLKAEGTMRIDRAIGMTGTVYLSIPGNNSGTGKVTVKSQNRTVEYQAITRMEALETGTAIQVVAVLGPELVEVIPVPQAERINHV